ncbi:FKBP-type peptidyl-prolyl cis-trans isomerase, partial [Anaplasma phagocytophilum]|uniref:FKBP-type peptidyl-prolyl cis-trans isomerase n=1 Tax=Anaplasma phagocytophilum TaxID=948 RepID=UPI00201AD3A1
MKKITCWVLKIAVVVSALFLVLRVVSVFLTENEARYNADKPYSLSMENSNSLGYRLGASLIRPILEARIDQYIKDQGLEDYFKNLTLKLPPKVSFSFNDMQEGNGSSAVCGQVVTAMVIQSSASDQEKIGTLSPAELAEKVKNSVSYVNFQLGTHEVSALNQGMIGMRANGSRVVTLNNDEDARSYYVNLTSIDSSEPTASALERFMVFDKVRTDYDYKKPITVSRCGDKVSVMYNVRDASGNAVYENLKAEFTIGTRQVPIALDLAAVDLQSDSIRSVIVPPDLLAGLSTDFDNSTIKILELWM